MILWYFIIWYHYRYLSRALTILIVIIIIVTVVITTVVIINVARCAKLHFWTENFQLFEFAGLNLPAPILPNCASAASTSSSSSVSEPSSSSSSSPIPEAMPLPDFLPPYEAIKIVYKTLWHPIFRPKNTPKYWYELNVLITFMRRSMRE